MTTHPRPSRARHVVTLLAVTVLLIAGCGDGDDDDGAGDTTTSSSAATSSSTDTTNDPSTSSTATSTSTSTSSSTISSSTTLPGEPITSLPDDGDVLGVVGVADGDVLNIRAIPGADTEILAAAQPTADDLVATGVARNLPTTIWYQIGYDGVTGWVNSSFVGFLGGTDDATAEFLAERDRPETETMVELGELVADAYASEEPASRIVQSVAPTVGDLGEVTYDVVGIGDDSVLGYRLHVFATLGDSGESFVLRSIERTVLCFRGLAGEICV